MRFYADLCLVMLFRELWVSLAGVNERLSGWHVLGRTYREGNCASVYWQ